MKRKAHAQWNGSIKDGKGAMKVESGLCEGPYSFTGIVLTTHCKIPQIDEKTFLNIAGKAKEGCPVSQALKVPIELKPSLV